MAHHQGEIKSPKKIKFQMLQHHHQHLKLGISRDTIKANKDFTLDALIRLHRIKIGQGQIQDLIHRQVLTLSLILGQEIHLDLHLDLSKGPMAILHLEILI